MKSKVMEESLNPEELKKDTIKKMKALKIYKKQYDTLIGIYANLICQYNKTLQKFIESGEQYMIEFTNKNGSTNFVKSPLYLILEKQRADIIIYTRELGLSPAGLKKISADLSDEKKSALEKALSAI